MTIMSDLTSALPETDRAAALARFNDFHQYYRDCLSDPVSFPGIGAYPSELIEWVCHRSNVDATQLAEYLATLPPSGLSPEHDLALRLALSTIVQANLATDYNNRYPGYTLPASVAATIKKGIGRVLELHPTGDYIALCVQLLYRIKETEQVLELAQAYPDIFARYPVLQAILGFIHTCLGEHQTALHYLQPLLADPALRGLPLVGLSGMTSQYRLGGVPEWPLSFSSLAADVEALPAMIARLPALELIRPLDDTTLPVAVVACDTRYFFEHARHLAYSLHATNLGKLNLHLHLYSPQPEVLVEIEGLRQRLPGLSIGVSAEYGSDQRTMTNTYFASARFVRAYQLLDIYRCPLCIMDADALFNGDWARFTGELPEMAELVLVRPAASPFWEQVLGGFVFCRPTPFARRYLAKVAQFILDNFERGQGIWFADQVALSACDDRFASGNPAVHHLDHRRVIDMQHTPDSLCWMVTTVKAGNPAYDAARARLERGYA